MKFSTYIAFCIFIIASLFTGFVIAASGQYILAFVCLCVAILFIAYVVGK